ncbi:MAG: hypothetical protein R3F19_00840 [Verrucomicrobiales bacterium]
MPILSDTVLETPEVFHLVVDAAANFRPEGQRIREQKIFPELGEAAQFGRSIGAWGEDWLFVGAPLSDQAVKGAGAVEIYRREPATDQWLHHQTIFATASSRNDAFGWALDVRDSDGVLAVSAPTYGSNHGTVYVFRPTDEMKWKQELQITVSDPTSDLALGQTVCISGNYIAVNSRIKTHFVRLSADLATWAPDGEMPEPLYETQAGPEGSFLSNQFRVGITVIKRIADSNWVLDQLIFEQGRADLSWSAFGNMLAVGEKYPNWKVQLLRWTGAGGWQIEHESEPESFGTFTQLALGNYTMAFQHPFGVRIADAIGTDVDPWQSITETEIALPDGVSSLGERMTFGERNAFLSTDVNGVLAAGDRSIQVTILDGKEPQLVAEAGIMLPLPSDEVGADFTRVAFPLRLDIPAITDLGVSYTIEGAGPEGNTTDAFPAINGTITIPAGESGARILVADVPLNLPELVALQLTIETANQATIVSGSSSVALVRREPLPSVTVLALPATLDEPSAGEVAAASFEISLDFPRPVETVISYDLVHRRGQEYEPIKTLTDQIVIVPAGELSARIDVEVKGDNVPEPDETWLLRLKDTASAPMAALFPANILPPVAQDPNSDLLETAANFDGNVAAVAEILKRNEDSSYFRRVIVYEKNPSSGVWAVTRIFREAVASSSPQSVSVSGSWIAIHPTNIAEPTVDLFSRDLVSGEWHSSPSLDGFAAPGETTLLQCAVAGEWLACSIATGPQDAAVYLFKARADGSGFTLMQTINTAYESMPPFATISGDYLLLQSETTVAIYESHFNGMDLWTHAGELALPDGLETPWPNPNPVTFSRTPAQLMDADTIVCSARQSTSGTVLVYERSPEDGKWKHTLTIPGGDSGQLFGTPLVAGDGFFATSRHLGFQDWQQIAFSADGGVAWQSTESDASDEPTGIDVATAITGNVRTVTLPYPIDGQAHYLRFRIDTSDRAH